MIFEYDRATKPYKAETRSSQRSTNGIRQTVGHKVDSKDWVDDISSSEMKSEMHGPINAPRGIQI